MISVSPPLLAEAEDMTVEVRDSRGIPYIQARVTALNAGDALAKASSAHPDTEWVFLRELSRDEIAQITHDHPGTANNGPADDFAVRSASSARSPELSEACARPSELNPSPRPDLT
jgi:hypothetical protein